MAGNDLPKQPESQGLSLSDIMQAINTGADTFAGKKKTTTTGQKFDQDQMNSMLKSILEQTGGYADVGQQAHAAGGYNSSTQGLMLNDLLTRSAQRVAELNTEQTVTEQVDPKIGQQGIQDVLGLLGGAQLLASGVKGIGGLLGIGGSGAEAANQGSSVGTLWEAGKNAFGFSSGGATTASDTYAITDSAGNLLDIGRSGAEATGNAAVDAGSSAAAGAEGASTWGATAGKVANGIGYAYQAHKGWQDIEDDNWGGAAGRAIGSIYGGPIVGEIGGFIGTAADKYILDPLNDSVVKPVGHLFDEAITQNVGSAVKSVGKTVGKGLKSVGHALGKLCFLGGTKILMADGAYKEISTLALGDIVAIGGRVTAIGSAFATDIYSYKGELCTGSHVVLEDGEWIQVQYSELATGPHGSQEYVVHPVTTENHVLVTANGFISSDYAGVDGDYSESLKLELLNADKERTADLAAELDDLFAETVQE